MRQFTSKELRKTWKEFYIERGHVDVGAVSLVSDGSTGVLFNVAGMQPLMPYLLGEKHPMGTRLCNVQGCVRTNDIDSVGDRSHVTFFEMMGRGLHWRVHCQFQRPLTSAQKDSYLLSISAVVFLLLEYFSYVEPLFIYVFSLTGQEHAPWYIWPQIFLLLLTFRHSLSH